MDERIIEHLKHLNKYYLLLADIRKKPYKDFKLFEQNVLKFIKDSEKR